MIDITEVHVFLRNDDKLRAFVSITIDGAFAVRGLKVIQGYQGLFVAMPSRKGPCGVYDDIAHPLNQEAREYLTQVVLEAYEAALTERSTLTGGG